MDTRDALAMWIEIGLVTGELADRLSSSLDHEEDTTGKFGLIEVERSKTTCRTWSPCGPPARLHHRLSAIVIVLVALSAGCGSSDSEPPNDSILFELDGTAWSVTSIDGSPAKGTINFSSTDGTISGHVIDDCLARTTTLRPSVGGFEVAEGLGPLADCDSPVAAMFAAGRMVGAVFDNSGRLILRSEDLTIVAAHFQSVSVQ